MRLLVGLDKREGGQDALELARVLAGGAGPEGEGSSALIASVLYADPLPLEYALLDEEDAEEAQPLFAAARERLAGLEVETRAYGAGSPAGILTTLAEREQFDAIVVGSPHRGALGRVMIGSTATSLLNGAPAAVAVAPRGYAAERHEAPHEIAVGYDGTPESKLALQRAEALAERWNARIRLITVVKPPVAAPVIAPGVYTPQFPPEPEKVLNEGLNSVDPRLAADRVRRDGDPGEELVRACEDGVDLLVVGSRGYGPMARVLLGSVSRRVVREAPCPALVTRRP